jgi:hypothetical protein
MVAVLQWRQRHSSHDNFQYHACSESHLLLCWFSDATAGVLCYFDSAPVLYVTQVLCTERYLYGFHDQH